LTNSQIEKSWPNLPSAKQLYEKDVCMVVDLRYSGKQASLMDDILPDPESPTVFDVASSIANYTTTTIDCHSGALKVNAPQVWLQYNSSVWVKVPSKYLQTATTPD